MKISIITVCYNATTTIADCMASVMNQNHTPIEYLIIDGNSTDGTQEIIENFLSQQKPTKIYAQNSFAVYDFSDNVVKVISEPDKGIYHAMNKGIENSTGDVVGILNADDVYSSNHVLGKVCSLFKESNAEAIYGDLVYVAAHDTFKISRYWKSEKYTTLKFLWGWMPPHPTFFVKRNIYEKYGLFDTQFRSASDYELMLRFMHKYSIKVSYLPEILVKMRQGGASNSNLKNRILANLEDRKAWRINGLKPYFFTLYLKPLNKISQFFTRK